MRITNRNVRALQRERKDMKFETLFSQRDQQRLTDINRYLQRLTEIEYVPFVCGAARADAHKLMYRSSQEHIEHRNRRRAIVTQL